MESNITKNDLAAYILRSQNFDTLLFDDPLDEEHVMIDGADTSTNLFPTINKLIKTGSRSERVYLFDSDVDYLYEVGPGKTFPENFCRSISFNLTYRKTSNDGYYHIFDQNRAMIYPRDIQNRLTPRLTVGKKWVRNKIYGIIGQATAVKTKASIEDCDGNDQVIAFPLNEWPEEIWREFDTENLKWCRGLIPKLKDTTLYLVSKNHPESDHPKQEWRLSFSMVEKEIMLRIPDVHRKAYVLCKWLKKIWFNDADGLQSFFLKTVLLNLLDKYSLDYCEWIKSKWFLGSTKRFTLRSMLMNDYYYSRGLYYVDESHLLVLVKNIFQELHNCYSKGKLYNYFIPAINLFEDIIECKRELAKNKLNDILKDFDSKICNDLEYRPDNFSLLPFIQWKQYVYLKDNVYCVLTDIKNTTQTCTVSNLRALFMLEAYYAFLDSLFTKITSIKKENETKQLEKLYFGLRSFLQDDEQLRNVLPEKCIDYVSVINCLFDIPSLTYGLVMSGIKCGVVDRSFDHCIYALQKVLEGKQLRDIDIKEMENIAIEKIETILPDLQCDRYFEELISYVKENISDDNIKWNINITIKSLQKFLIEDETNNETTKLNQILVTPNEMIRLVAKKYILIGFKTACDIYTSIEREREENN